MVVTFFATCIGVAFSFMASDFDALVPVVLYFCFLFAIGMGYSATANYLANKARRTGAVEPSMQSFRLEKAYRKPTSQDNLSGEISRP